MCFCLHLCLFVYVCTCVVLFVWVCVCWIPGSCQMQIQISSKNATFHQIRIELFILLRRLRRNLFSSLSRIRHKSQKVQGRFVFHIFRSETKLCRKNIFSIFENFALQISHSSMQGRRKASPSCFFLSLSLHVSLCFIRLRSPMSKTDVYKLS